MTGGSPILKTAALSIATTTGDDGNVTPPFAIRSSEEAFRHVCNSAYIQSLGGPARGPIPGISGLGHQRKRIGSTSRRGDCKRGALQMPVYQYSYKPAIEPLKKPVSALAVVRGLAIGPAVADCGREIGHCWVEYAVGMDAVDVHYFTNV